MRLLNCGNCIPFWSSQIEGHALDDDAGVLFGVRSSETLPSHIVILQIFLANVPHSIAELNAGIMCSCMPIVFVLFKSIIKKKDTAPEPYFQSSGSKISNGGQEQQLPSIPQPPVMGMGSFTRETRS